MNLNKWLGYKFKKRNIAECFGEAKKDVYFKKTNLIENNDYLIIICGIKNTDIKYFIYIDENKIIKKITSNIDYTNINDVIWKGSNKNGQIR